MIDHNPKECPNYELIQHLTQEIKILKEKHDESIGFLKGEQIRERERTEKIFDLLDKMSISIDKIQITVEGLSTKQDPFKETMFSLGMWAVKVLIGGGALIWASSKFGG